MNLVTLKKIEQDIWLSSGGGLSKYGVCYYMCNFLESDLGIWNEPGSFINAVESAKNFGQGTAMMNYAKSQNSQKQPQANPNLYRVLDRLDQNSIYRVQLFVGTPIPNRGEVNHEIIAVTGDNDEIVFFEPNFGFYQPQEGNHNREDLESAVQQLYTQDNVYNFEYYKVRDITSSVPKSYQS
jgi:hypothetical protein